MPAGGGPAATAAPSGPLAMLAGMGGGGGAPGQDPNDAGNSYAAMSSDQRGLQDSGAAVQQLRRIQRLLAVMAVHFLPSIPSMAGQLSKTVPMFDRIIKEAQQAANVNSVVRQPIQMGAAQPNPQSQSQPSTGMPPMAMAA